MMMDYFECFIPSCRNTSTNSPNKVFVKVREDLKKTWCSQVNVVYSPIFLIHCCEDHLNLEEDLKNYKNWKWFGGKPVLKPTATLRHLPGQSPAAETYCKKESKSQDSSELMKLLTGQCDNEIEMSAKRRKIDDINNTNRIASVEPSRFHIGIQSTVRMVDKSTNYAVRKMKCVKCSQGVVSCCTSREVDVQFDSRSEQLSSRPCSSCLSYGRDLQPLGDLTDLYCTLVLEENNPSEVLVCWECRGALRRCASFQQQAARARDVLTSIHQEKEAKITDNSRSLSTLAKVDVAYTSISSEIILEEHIIAISEETNMQEDKPNHLEYEETLSAMNVNTKTSINNRYKVNNMEDIGVFSEEIEEPEVMLEEPLCMIEDVKIEMEDPLEQGWANYGPPAISGPRATSIGPANVHVFNVIHDEHVSLHGAMGSDARRVSGVPGSIPGRGGPGSGQSGGDSSYTTEL